MPLFISAQTFFLVSGTPFEGVRDGSIAFADIDNDNDQDVLITGLNSSYQIISKLYTNDGVGNYTLVSGTPFVGVMYSCVKFADIDNDNDQDLIISGAVNSSQAATKLYTNDGSGNFTLVVGTPFDAIEYSSVEFGDIDNDNDQDIIITGQKSSGVRIAKLYKNDGNGFYTIATGTPFTGVESGDIEFADVDNDNDLDVLITGMNSSNASTSRLYLNDSLGNFTFQPLTPFEGANVSSIAFSDVDNDNDFDVLITGSNNQPKSKLYLNNGSGNFTLDTLAPFDGVQYSSVAFSDVDNDNDDDLIISGESWNLQNGFQRICKLYLNNGNGSFSLLSGTTFEGITTTSVAFSDTNNDNKIDLLITGSNGSNIPITKLYRDTTITTEIIQEVDFFNKITISPNPTNGIFNLDFGNLKNVSIQIFNISGQKIFEEKNISSNTFKVILDEPRGIYFLEIKTQNEQQIYKIVKE